MKQTLDYLKDRYSEEQARFDHFENKCSKFITFVTIIIAAITALAGIKDGLIFRPSSKLDWVMLVVFFGGALSIVCAWGHALSALRIGDYTVLPRSRETAEYLKIVEDDLVSNHIYNCYVDTLERLAIDVNKKSRQLELAYEELSISAWCLGLVAILTIYMEMIK